MNRVFDFFCLILSVLVIPISYITDFYENDGSGKAMKYNLFIVKSFYKGVVYGKYD